MRFQIYKVIEKIAETDTFESAVYVYNLNNGTTRILDLKPENGIDYLKDTIYSFVLIISTENTKPGQEFHITYEKNEVNKLMRDFKLIKKLNSWLKCNLKYVLQIEI